VKPTLRVKIVSGFALATVATLAVGLLAVQLLRDAREAQDAAFRTTKRQISTLASIDHLLMDNLKIIAPIVYDPERAGQDETPATASARPMAIQAHEQATVELLALGAEPLSPEARAIYDELVTTQSWYGAALNSAIGANLQVPDASVTPLSERAVTEQGAARLEDLRAQLTQLRGQLDTDADRANQAAAADVSRAMRTFIMVSLAVGFATLGFGVWLAGHLVRPIRGTVKVLQRVADGDLTARIEDTTRDEVGEMAVALNTSVGTLRDVVHQIEADADSLARMAQRDRSGGDRVTSGTASAAMSGSSDRAAELVDMADHLTAMISVFVTKAGDDPDQEDVLAGVPS
jgi:methyl-accepting chemotaxis protein